MCKMLEHPHRDASVFKPRSVTANDRGYVHLFKIIKINNYAKYGHGYGGMLGVVRKKQRIG